jgi:hypothetical protein
MNLVQMNVAQMDLPQMDLAQMNLPQMNFHTWPALAIEKNHVANRKHPCPAARAAREPLVGID